MWTRTEDKSKKGVASHKWKLRNRAETDRRKQTRCFSLALAQRFRGNISVNFVSWCFGFVKPEGPSAELLPPAHFPTFGVQLGFEPRTLRLSAWYPIAGVAPPPTDNELV